MCCALAAVLVGAGCARDGETEREKRAGLSFDKKKEDVLIMSSGSYSSFDVMRRANLLSLEAEINSSLEIAAAGRWHHDGK
jgi:hypothetical protein